MGDVPPVADGEILLRHIPGGTTWVAPGPRITSMNFRPRTALGETTVSVNRLLFTTPTRLLELVGGDPARGSRVAWATAGEVRAVGVRVNAVPILPHDPGHAELSSAEAADLTGVHVQRRLATLFRFADVHPFPGSPTPSDPE